MARALALGFALTTSLAVAAASAGQAPDRAGARSTAQTTDAAFVAKVHDASAMLRDLARLGTARAADASTKVFAKRLLEEQMAIAEGVVALARAKRVELAPPPAAVREETETLARQAGPAFDRAFVAAVVKSHDATVALFEAEAAEGRDEDVKEWAARQLPALRERQAKARALHDEKAKAYQAGARS